jgi:hypothetical protein
MVKFRAEVNEVNPYKIVVDTLGKEKEEKTFSTPYGAVSVREWDGVTVIRRVEYDFEKNKYVMVDDVIVDEKKHPELVKKLREAKAKEVLEEVS